MRKTREYLRMLRKAFHALEASIDAFNHVNHPYRNEATLMLMTNAWELLAKSILKRKHHSIAKDKLGNTISAEIAVSKLRQLQLLDDNQEDCVQQIVSLRHAATHFLLPDVPDEVMHHLLFFGCKFFRGLVQDVFPTHMKELQNNYLSLSFSDMTTYADKVQKLVSHVKKHEQEKRLVWLLERGIRFDGTTYITQSQFEAQYKRRKRIMPHLGLSDFIRDTEMVRIVAVQAPRNFTADITLRKGSRRDASLPVVVQKTDLETDYPFLTKEIAAKIGRNQNFVANAMNRLGVKGDPKYHQGVRASKSSHIQRYSQAAVDKLVALLKENPTFNPYHQQTQKQPNRVPVTD